MDNNNVKIADKELLLMALLLFNVYKISKMEEKRGGEVKE